MNTVSMSTIRVAGAVVVRSNVADIGRAVLVAW